MFFHHYSPTVYLYGYIPHSTTQKVLCINSPWIYFKHKIPNIMQYKNHVGIDKNNITDKKNTANPSYVFRNYHLYIYIYILSLITLDFKA